MALEHRKGRAHENRGKKVGSSKEPEGDVGFRWWVLENKGEEVR